MKNPVVWIPVLALTLSATTAHADVPPPEDYVETCTVERQQTAGSECVECLVTYQDFDACKKTYEPQGYERRCQTHGASVYTEVFCREATAPEPGTGGATGTGTGTAAATATGTLPTTGTDTGTGTAPDPNDVSESSNGCSLAGMATNLPSLSLLAGALGLLGLRRRTRQR